jgi:hypothetical protein
MKFREDELSEVFSNVGQEYKEVSKIVKMLTDAGQQNHIAQLIKPF